MTEVLFKPEDDWTFDLLRKTYDEIEKIGLNELNLNVYRNQIEIISFDQMLENYSSVGLPVMYDHWSFGKRYLQEEFKYRKGMSGLAYELVINSDPCINYCMEENSMTMQALVLAHAAMGHNHFFKNNYLFKQWTSADGIIDYLVFAKKFIAKCEEDHGPVAVREVLDAAHALQNYGIDKYKRPEKLNKHDEERRQKERADYLQQQVNLLWSTLPEPTKRRNGSKEAEKPERFKKLPSEPQENILYFLEKHSPVLEPWEREILRIVRKLAQYFYPQRQTKMMNEGFATFTHYYIMNRLFDKGLITDGSMMEFLHSHSNVITQRPYDSKVYSGYNPYALGFDLLMDVKRMCTNPTEEDKYYMGHIAGKDWLETILDAVENFRDESGINQYLSPALIKKWQLFKIDDIENSDHHKVLAVQNESHFQEIRQGLAQQYNISRHQPNIEVVDANIHGSRTLVLHHTPRNKERLEETQKKKFVAYTEFLWGYPAVFDNDSETVADSDVNAEYVAY